VGKWQSALGYAVSLLEFYRGKKVLVTGHTGFKGGWLTIWLQLLGAEVLGFALPPETHPNLFSCARVADGIVSEFGDVRDFASVKQALFRHNPDIVIHNAAQALVRRSYREPVATYATNVMGTVHVLEAARLTPSVRAVVVVTSDKCYENREWVRGYKEDDAMGGHDPYSSSKGAAELVTAAYRRSYFHGDTSAAIASARAGNVIGGGDWSEDRLLPDIVRGISSDTPTVIRRPESVRPWQHVLEPLSGYLLLGKKLCDDGSRYAAAWNFGPTAGDSITAAEVADRVRTLWGKGELRIQPDPNAPHEATYLRLDCAKSSEELGWRPRLRLSQGLAWTVEWYREFYESSSVSARELTEHQIQAYMQADPL
jgi:CDP-glucose 4,6-dehydratase